MARKMLIDATHPEETRVVVVNGNKVEEFDFDSTARGLITGNIYLAKITRVEPSLQAAFVDYGGNRHGFLAFSEIHPDYYQIPQADREALMLEEIARQEAEAEAEDADLEEVSEPEVQAKPRSRSRRFSSKNRVKAESSVSDDKVQSDVIEDNDVLETSPETIEPETTPSEIENDFASENLDENESKTAVESETTLENEAVEVTSKPKSRSRRNYSRKSQPSSLDDPRDAVEPELISSESAEFSPAETVSTSDDDDIREIRPSHQKTREPRLRPHNRYKIQEVVKVRQIMLVQIIKEERGNKGAALTTYLSLPGRYCVLMPNTARGGGISRKIANIPDRKRLKTLAKGLNVPKGAGLIVRTAGAKQDTAEIERDYAFLTRQWNKIRELTLASTAPSAVYAESGPIKRAIRDLLTNDTDEILVEGQNGFDEASEYMNILMPERIKDVKLYKDTMPLFSRYQVEGYLASMFNPIVQLKSGGYLVIGVTEALIAVDVNSGRSTKESSIEDTAVKTNLEAAEEVARQLKLRDLAGLIVIDFIDMEQRRHQADVENRLKDALRKDRARIQIGRISSFGLLEMSRQRLRTGLVEAITQPCPHCSGTGTQRSDDNLALAVIRAIEEEIARGRSNEITAHVPMNVANFLFNEKREHINGFDARHGVIVKIIADPEQIAPNFKLEKSKNPERAVPKAAEPIRAETVMDATPEEEGSKAAAGKRRRRRGGKGRNKPLGEGEIAEASIEGQEGSSETQSTDETAPPANEKQGLSRTTSRSSRSRKPRTNAPQNIEATEGTVAVEAAVVEVSVETAVEVTPQAKKPARAKAAPRKKAETPMVEATGESEELAEAKPKPKPRRSSAKPAVKAEAAEVVAEVFVSAPTPVVVEKPQTEKPQEDQPQSEKPKKKGWWNL